MTDNLCETCAYAIGDFYFDEDEEDYIYEIEGCRFKKKFNCTECEFYEKDEEHTKDIKDHVQKMFDAAAIVTEQKKGHWVTNEVGVVRCSECHANMRLRNNKRPNFCDVCGADMRGIR